MVRPLSHDAPENWDVILDKHGSRLYRVSGVDGDDVQLSLVDSPDDAETIATVVTVTRSAHRLTEGLGNRYMGLPQQAVRDSEYVLLDFLSNFVDTQAWKQGRNAPVEATNLVDTWGDLSDILQLHKRLRDDLPRPTPRVTPPEHETNTSATYNDPQPLASNHE